MMQEIQNFIGKVIQVGRIVCFCLLAIVLLAVITFVVILTIKAAKALSLYIRTKRIKRLELVALITGRYHEPWKIGWFGFERDEEWNVEVAYLLPGEIKDRQLTFNDSELYEEVKNYNLCSMDLVLDVHSGDRLTANGTPEVLKVVVIKKKW